MLLAHGTLELADVIPVALAELGVSVGRVSPVGFDVLFPEQLQGHALAPQLAMDQAAIGRHSSSLRRRRLGAKPRLDLVFIQVGDRQPGQTLALGQTDELRHRPQAYAEGGDDLSMTQPNVELEPENFLDSAHGYSPCRHACSPKNSGACRRWLAMRNPLPQLPTLLFRHREHLFRSREHPFRKTRKSVHVQPKQPFTINRNQRSR